MKIVGSVVAVALALLSPGAAQDSNGDTPLGDLARSFRKKTASQQTVIDNDNFSKVVEDAASRRLASSSLVFSLDPGANAFKVTTTPDVTCSLSFSANASALLTDPVAPEQLPPSELAKLDGPATIDGDSLQVSIHNGTQWELRELIIGLTILKRQEPGDAAFITSPKLVPAVAGTFLEPVEESTQKRPDATVLLRIRGAAAPSATAIFRTALTAAITPDQDWHWAILRAKGIPPQSSVESAPMQSAQGPEQLPPTEPGMQVPAPAPLPATQIPPVQ